jgi:hypothetical protein
MAARIDNGGALLFHADGRRKTSEEFPEEVRELGMGTDREHLGLGIRQAYPGITDEEIHAQALQLKEVATDEYIEQRNDSVRLSRQDRDFLKARLRVRRDDILRKVLQSA